MYKKKRYIARTKINANQMLESPSIPIEDLGKPQFRLFYTIASGLGYPLTLINGKLVLDPRVFSENPISLHGRTCTGIAFATNLFTGNQVSVIVTDAGTFYPRGTIKSLPPTMFTTGDGKIHHIPNKL